jgi:predicted  nucleic acid-binding Zn-ribbon protein
LARLKAWIEVEARAAAERAARVEIIAAEPEPDPRAALEVALGQSRERIEKLEGERKAASQTEARLRKRIDNQEQLYASLRGELEAKKDRLRTQEEQLQRLQALKVAVLD